jgi:hypothetical protein
MSLLRRVTALALVAATALVVRPAVAHAAPMCDVPNPPPVCGPDVPDTTGTIAPFTTNKQPGEPYSRVSFTYGAAGATSTRVYTRHGWGTAGLPWSHMDTFSGGAVKTTPGYWYYSGEKVEFQIRSYVGSTQKDSKTVCVAVCSLN